MQTDAQNFDIPLNLSLKIDIEIIELMDFNDYKRRIIFE